MKKLFQKAGISQKASQLSSPTLVKDPLSGYYVDRQFLAQSTKVPGVLAQRILEQEFLCQSEKIDTQEITKLTQLYTQAVEYYESIGSEKYKIYRKRMEQFFAKGTVDQFLRGKSAALARQRQKTLLQIKESRLKSVGEANRLMVQIQKKAEKHKTILDKNIADQESSLSIRLRKRMSRSITTSRTAAEDQQPTSPHHPKSSHISEYSPDLEYFLKRQL